MKKPLIVVAGPTACGKTAVSIALAKILDGEIISGDSMQVYRGMDIGTAKPTSEERDGVPHHLIDILDPDEAFSAAVFQRLAKEAAEGIHERGRIPILAGGTGFYINAAVYDCDFSPDNELQNALREKYTALAAEEGAEGLHARLRAVDPQTAEKIHPNNIKRVARALAYYESTGDSISGHNAVQRRNEAAYDTLFIILNRERARLYEAIDARTDKMLERGLESEVRALFSAGYDEKLTSMQAIGYKEMLVYLRGGCTLESAAETIKTETRRYAKRQLTWFKHQTNGIWLDMEDKTSEKAAELIYELFTKRAMA